MISELEAVNDKIEELMEGTPLGSGINIGNIISGNITSEKMEEILSVDVMRVLDVCDSAAPQISTNSRFFFLLFSWHELSIVSGKLDDNDVFKSG